MTKDPSTSDLTHVLSTNLDEDDECPYFLWDDPVTNRELRHMLSHASPPERHRLLGKILREARDPDVWRYTSPDEVAGAWPELAGHLGRRRAFWLHLLTHWARRGRIHFEPTR